MNNNTKKQVTNIYCHSRSGSERMKSGSVTNENAVETTVVCVCVCALTVVGLVLVGGGRVYERLERRVLQVRQIGEVAALAVVLLLLVLVEQRELFRVALQRYVVLVAHLFLPKRIEQITKWSFIVNVFSGVFVFVLSGLFTVSFLMA